MLKEGKYTGLGESFSINCERPKSKERLLESEEGFLGCLLWFVFYCVGFSKFTMKKG